MEGGRGTTTVWRKDGDEGSEESTGEGLRASRRVERASVLVKMRCVIVCGRRPGSVWSGLEELPVLGEHLL